jgi:uncharacterized protein
MTMSESSDGLNRRRFLQAASAAGIGSVLASSAAQAAAQAASGSAAVASSGSAPAKAAVPVEGQVPRRKLGKTGVEISVIGLGNGLFSLETFGDGLSRCIDLGITYWDTSISYGGGESGIGKYLAAHPGARDKVFINTKSADIPTPLPVIADVDKQLKESLKRLKVDYIDMYCGVHAMGDAKQLTDDLRKWAEDQKKKGLFKFFGFSTHSNMGRNLQAAAKMDWIDACLTRADFRNVREKEMADGIDAITKANIGLISIKAMSVGMNPSSAEDKKLTFNFTDKGFDAYQAKLKAHLEDKRFAAAAVGMKTIAMIESCAAAAMDKTKLTDAHWQALDEYAQATCDNYCAGCHHICAAALPDTDGAGDLMRYLMYSRSYGDHDRARALFARIPADVRRRLRDADFSLAEARCPQHIAIGRLVEEAFRHLA